MEIHKLCSLVPTKEAIAVRLCGKGDEERYIITKKDNQTPELRFRLYEISGDKLVFTGKTAANPIQLEEDLG